MARVRFGLVGTGHWAREVHAAGLASHPDVEFAGVWGRDPAAVSALAARHSIRGYDDLEVLIADVDAVAFAVPPFVQAGLALRAAEAGKHLMLEKPLALDLAEADRVVEAVERRGLSTVLFLTQRFVPAWEEWLTAAASTPLEGGRADWLTSHAGKDNPYAASAWRREHGALWDVGPHMVSQVITALGPVAGVVGARGTGDLVHLILTHVNGATSRMSLSLSMPPAATRVGVEFYGPQGWTEQPALERDVAQAYGIALDELIAGIGSGEARHRCDVRVGRELTEVLLRCEEALRAP